MAPPTQPPSNALFEPETAPAQGPLALESESVSVQLVVFTGPLAVAATPPAQPSKAGTPARANAAQPAPVPAPPPSRPPSPPSKSPASRPSVMPPPIGMNQLSAGGL